MKRLNGKSPSDKQRKKLPQDWKENFSDLEAKSTTQTTIALRFGVSSSVILRWRKDHKNFRDEYDRVHLPQNRVPPKPKPKIIAGKLTDDQIDDCVLALCDEPSAYHAKLARAAIKQLRAEKRAIQSRLNQFQHAEHMRKSGGSPTTHQNGNATATRA